MAKQPEEKPVGPDDVSQIEGGVAVGEDLDFQRRWWRFERIIWTFFSLVLIADLLGLLGRGPLANAERRNDSIRIKYERVLRENTSSILTILPADGAIHNGELQLFVSDSIVKQLGAQRVIPQPKTSMVGNGGITYTFPAAQLPLTIQIELKPSFIGNQPFTIAVPGSPAVQAKSLVLP